MNRLKLYREMLPIDQDKLMRFIQSHTDDLENSSGYDEVILEDATLTLFDGMSGDDLIESLSLIGAQNIQNDPVFDKIAMRFTLTRMLDSALSVYEEAEYDQSYRESFVRYIEWGVEEKLLDPQMIEKFNLYELALYLKPSRDDDYTYIGLTTAWNRYTIKNRESKSTRETPQFMWMRVAMGMSLNEEEPTKYAKKFYESLSKKEYIPGGSTMIAAGTPNPSLANCFLLDTEDDIDHIFENVTNVAKISKATGGIGLAVTKLRAEGSPIRSNNTFSSGPIPFINILDATVAAIARAGKKKGAMAIYMENWHYNFPEFLDLKQNAGDEYRRVRTANTAVYLSDEFMKRVEQGEQWYMFDPFETRELTELYGKEFSEKYAEYIDKAEAGDIRMFKKVPAREQYKKILAVLQATSHPWLIWKDSINLRALNNNTGTIHCSNLCTEVCLPTDKDNIAVCNLVYVNFPRHIRKQSVQYGADLKVNMNKAVDWSGLEKSVRMGMRHLDNLIEVGYTPLPQSRNSDQKNRAVGLGIMGFAESLEFLGYAYDSEESYTLIDQVMEFISFVTIDESCNLAQERGAYDNFEGSMWSKGFVPYDTIEKLADDRGVELKMNRDITLDWDRLRERVKKGVRNATTMMIAPNGNSSLMADTSPGIDPRFALIFSRTTLSGKFLDMNLNLANLLKGHGIWDDVKELILEAQGDISMIEAIPQEIKDVYKTSFQIDPLAYVEVASRAQKWVDQSMSRNMYLESRDIDDMMDTYLEAWRRGLKTTYYLHMKPRHTAEQSTVKVNKAKKIGKSGFSGTRERQAVEVSVPVSVTPVNDRPVSVTIADKEAKQRPVGFGSIGKSVKSEEDVVFESAVAESEAGLESIDEKPTPTNVGAARGFAKVKNRAEGNSPSNDSPRGFGSKHRVSDSQAAQEDDAQIVTQSASASLQMELSEPDLDVAEISADQAVKQEPKLGFTVSESSGKIKRNSKVKSACPVDPRERALCDGCE